jgi:hypothetical protein
MMYSLQSIRAGKMLGYYTSELAQSKEYVIGVIGDVLREVLENGLGMAQYGYEPTGETHQPTGAQIYRVTSMDDGRAMGTLVLSPCLDARGLKWMAGFDTKIGFGVYFTKETELMSGATVAWDEKITKDKRLHIVGREQRLTQVGVRSVPYEVTTLSHGKGGWTPQFGELNMCDNALAENLFLTTDAKPIVDEGTSLRNLKVFTHAPKFSSGISITGGYSIEDTEEVPKVYIEYEVDGEPQEQAIPLRRSKQKDSRYMVVGPVGPENGTLTAMLADDGVIYVTRGCFEGALKDFREAVEHTHGHKDSQFGREYQAIIRVIKARFPDGREE